MNHPCHFSVSRSCACRGVGAHVELDGEGVDEGRARVVSQQPGEGGGVFLRNASLVRTHLDPRSLLCPRDPHAQHNPRAALERSAGTRRRTSAQPMHQAPPRRTKHSRTRLACALASTPDYHARGTKHTVATLDSHVPRPGVGVLPHRDDGVAEHTQVRPRADALNRVWRGRVPLVKHHGLDSDVSERRDVHVSLAPTRTSALRAAPTTRGLKMHA